MSRQARIAAAVALLLAGGIAGAAATFWYLTRPLLEGSERSNRLWMESEAYARYRFGDYPTARRALLSHALLAEVALRDVEACKTCERRELKAELAMAYARLFVIASRAGQVEDQKAFFSKAAAVYASDGHNATEDQLRTEVAQYDEHWNANFKDVK